MMDPPKPAGICVSRYSTLHSQLPSHYKKSPCAVRDCAGSIVMSDALGSVLAGGVAVEHKSAAREKGVAAELDGSEIFFGVV